ncbi:unnamed protein product [Alternaria alternata]
MESVALGSLCEECQQLQIGRLFDRNDPEDGTTVEEIPIMRTWMPKGCRLCDFIIECLPTECRGRNVDVLGRHVGGLIRKSSLPNVNSTSQITMPSLAQPETFEEKLEGLK